MIEPTIVKHAYETLQANPKWQTGFHDPITGTEDLWDRFLEWFAHLHLGFFFFSVVLRCLVLACVVWGVHFFQQNQKSRDSQKARSTRPIKTLATRASVPTVAAPVYRDPATLIAEADILAQSGQFLNATSLLFKAGIAAADNRGTVPIGPAATLREVGSLPFAAKLRESFGHIGSVIEQGRFGGKPIDAAAYKSCRHACEYLADPGSWGI